MMNRKVLVIDDDRELCDLIKNCAEQEFYTVDVSHTGVGGYKMAVENTYQLILLDVMLPVMNGFSILTEIRKISMVPVLMLTAKDAESDKVNGLKLGADDYLTKPFGIRELLARMDSLVRRYTTFNHQDRTLEDLLLKGMKIDYSHRTVQIQDILVELTGKEFDLLYFLASHPGCIFTKKQIYQQVWEEAYAFDDNNIMSFICKLRKKIEPDIDNPYYIQTIRGVGYRFNQEAVS